MKVIKQGGGQAVSGCLTVLGDGDVGQPIMAAAAFQAASLLVREISALQQQDPIRWSSAEPPEKAAAATIGCPTSLSPKTVKHPAPRIQSKSTGPMLPLYR